MQSFTLPRLLGRERQLERIGAFLAGLSVEKGWTVEVKQLQRRRSNQQNRYLFGVAYPAILSHLQGWTIEDVHEYCLGECFGWETLDGLNRKRLKPLKRSHTLTVTEFQDYVAWIQQDMAGRGIYVPDPNEDMEAAA
jgi:hypothetical protein